MPGPNTTDATQTSTTSTQPDPTTDVKATETVATNDKSPQAPVTATDTETLSPRMLRKLTPLDGPMTRIEYSMLVPGTRDSFSIIRVSLPSPHRDRTHRAGSVFDRRH